MQEDVDDDVPRLYDHSAHITQYDWLWLSDNEKWQEFIQRAYLRGLGAPWDDEEQAEQQAAVPRAGDKLWKSDARYVIIPLPKMLFTWK